MRSPGQKHGAWRATLRGEAPITFPSESASDTTVPGMKEAEIQNEREKNGGQRTLRQRPRAARGKTQRTTHTEATRGGARPDNTGAERKARRKVKIQNRIAKLKDLINSKFSSANLIKRYINI